MAPRREMALTMPTDASVYIQISFMCILWLRAFFANAGNCYAMRNICEIFYVFENMMTWEAFTVPAFSAHNMMMLFIGKVI